MVPGGFDAGVARGHSRCIAVGIGVATIDDTGPRTSGHRRRYR